MQRQRFLLFHLCADGKFSKIRSHITVSKIFSAQAYCHLLTVLSSIITCKLNPRVYNSLLVLLDAVRLYRVYRWLDTLPLYLYYELLVIIIFAVPGY